MKIKSTLLSLLFFSFFFTNEIAAQAIYPVSLDEKVQQSQLIFEGTVVSKSSYWNPQHTMIFTSNKVKIHKLFKGTYTDEFIEVLTEGGLVGTESIHASDLAELTNDQTGMFFCFPNNINLRNPATNAAPWEIYSSAQGILTYNLNSKVAAAPLANYNNIVNDLYPAITQRTGQSYRVVNPQFVVSAEPAPQTEALAITSFTPASVIAGSLQVAENILTINGTDFGNAAGSAAVLFDNANDDPLPAGSVFAVPYNDPLMISWSNTQIVLRVPTQAGTGTLQVREELGGVVSAPTPLNVSYSLLSRAYGTHTGTYTLMNDDGSGGYNLVYSTNTANGGVDLNTSPVKAVFQRALNTWRETVGVNFTENGTTTSQQVNPSDGLNTIMFDNTAKGVAVLGAGTLAVCYSFATTCTPLGSVATRLTEFDIVIRNNGVSLGTTTFNNGPCYPASGIDMESVLLHELGHAIGLGHINDTYQFAGGATTTANPGKVMHFSVVGAVARKSPDWSAFTGANYCVQPKGFPIGSCIAPNAVMVPLAATTEPKDECPGSFPVTATNNNTLVNFDLVHATSNKNVDPQYQNTTCNGLGSPVTNTAYYAIRTNTSGTLDITVTGYTTVPADLSACAASGVRLALYQVSNCPTGQAFPAPVTGACRSFNASGTLASITGLAANTNYLIFVDGILNTKANFNLLLNGTALPVRVSDFNGAVKPTYNDVFWKLELTSTLKTIILQSGNDGINFSDVYQQTPAANSQRVDGSFGDYEIADRKYYRLKMVNVDGSTEYSAVLLLRREVKSNSVIVAPNPAKDHVNILMNRKKAASLTIHLIDAAGKKLLTKTQMAVPGVQTIQVNNLDKFSAGNYILQVWDGEKNSTYKLVIQ